MKKLLILFVLISSFMMVKSQTPGTYDKDKRYGQKINRFWVVKSLHIPVIDTALIDDDAADSLRGCMLMQPSDSLVYVYDGHKWTKVSGGGAPAGVDSTIYATVHRLLTDSAYLKGLIDGKINTADSSFAYVTIKRLKDSIATRMPLMTTLTKALADTAIKYSTLIPGAEYKITGVHTALYNDGTTPGTTIFLKAVATNAFSLIGRGMFYNPKYNNATVGFGVCDTSLTTYAIGDTSIWGQYIWICNTAGKPTATSATNLGSTFTKVPYSSGVYWTVYDEIDFDYANNLIVRRREVDVNNEVICPRTTGGSTIYTSGASAIGVFQWGNKAANETTSAKGLSANKIDNSYVECVNFRGARFVRNQFLNNSKFSTVFMGINTVFEHNIFNRATFTGSKLDSTANMTGNIFIQCQMSSNYFNQAGNGNAGLINCWFYGLTPSIAVFTGNYCYKGTYTNVILNGSKITGDSIVSNTTPSTVGYNNLIMENSSIVGGKRTAGLQLNTIVLNYQWNRVGTTISTADSATLNGSKNIRYPNILTDAVNVPVYMLALSTTGDTLKKVPASIITGVNLGSNDLINTASTVRHYNNNGRSIYFDSTQLLRIARNMSNYGYVYDFGKTLDLNNYDSLYTTGINAESGTRYKFYYEDKNNKDTASAIELNKKINIYSHDSIVFGIQVDSPHIVITNNGLIKYTVDRSPIYDNRTLVDKGYVASQTTTIIVHTGLIKAINTAGDTMHLYVDTTGRVTTQTASYTITMADQYHTTIVMNVASANDINIPNDATLNFPIGTTITGISIGAGQTTIVPGGSVTLISADSKTKSRVAGSVFEWKKIAANTWTLYGDISL